MYVHVPWLPYSVDKYRQLPLGPSDEDNKELDKLVST